MKRNFYKKILHQTYNYEREPALAKFYATKISKYLTELDVGFIFSPGTLPIAYLITNKPIIFWTDATFAGMINFYPEFSSL